MTRDHLLWLAAGVIVLTNVAALAGAAWNRSGEPDSSLVLSERELQEGYRFGLERESSGRTLRLRYRTPTGHEDQDLGHYGYYDQIGWLTRPKLRELGFAPERWDSKGRDHRELPRRLLFVLELDGPAHRRAIAGLKTQAESLAAEATAHPDSKEVVGRSKAVAERLDEEQQQGTRLYVVDAGLDAATLRQRYPDRSRYAIAAGHLRVYDVSEEHGYGRVELLTAELHVPAGAAPGIGDRRVGSRGERSPFRVTVHFGQRHEPWIANIATAAGR